MNKLASVVVLPFPLSVAALFSYGILRFLGFINETAHTRFTRVSSPLTSLFSCEGRIINLQCAQLHQRMMEIEMDEHCKRIFGFSAFGDARHSQTEVIHSRLVSALNALNTNTSRRALNEVFLLISERRIRGWRSLGEIEAFVIALENYSKIQPRVLVYPPDIRSLSLPVYKTKKGVAIDEDAVNDYFDVTLKMGRILELQDRHLCVVIGGEPNVGKSTLAVSLVAEMKHCIRSLSPNSFPGLEFGVEVVDLDSGSPTTKAIAERWATDRERLFKEKRPWTMERAEEAHQELLRSKSKYNILVGDLPGLITDFTRLTASGADAGIIISRDQGITRDEWIPFMSSEGLPIVSRIKRREIRDGFSSLVTKWCPGESLNGNVVMLNRLQKSWDPFIQWLALFLLFDILPSRFDAGS